MRRFSEMRWEIRQTTKEKIMGIFSMILSLLSGVALFLFGMSLMGDGLKMVAGNKLEAFLYRMTNTPLKGVALGTGVTSVIQSSSATTVMVIGFVNSSMILPIFLCTERLHAMRRIIPIIATTAEIVAVDKIFAIPFFPSI